MQYPRSPRLRFISLGVTLLVALGAALHNHLPQRLYYGASTARAEAAWADRSVWLPQYRSMSPAVVVEGVQDNLSGLTYDPRRDRLWAVTNDPAALLLLSKSGRVEGRYELEGFHDVEAVSWIDADLLLLAEERRGTQVLVEIPATIGPIPRAQARVLAFHAPSDENDGFEGSAYDVAGDTLFVVKERNPKRLLEYPQLRATLARGELPTPIDRSGWLFPQVFAHDLSSIDFDPKSGHLLLLSDKSKRLFELGQQGALISFRSLTRRDHAIGIDIPQAEGVALDAAGTLYIVSEPNLFYRFDRTERAVDEPNAALATAEPAGPEAEPLTPDGPREPPNPGCSTAEAPEHHWRETSRQC
jgi:uncharacterized protein YjiK